ncbi:hypothetical protein [uncultured Lawsonella sp.]|uniref:hypothetical protein n=1 Tax=uncultured Lawsonella sp. TaxID=1847727 RepID=UPI002615378B|nr:hypothetical protein [uncultured Lawsonella sp.]
MAKKKSERSEHDYFSRVIPGGENSSVTVYDGDYCMGTLDVLSPENPLYVEVVSPATIARVGKDVPPYPAGNTARTEELFTLFSPARNPRVTGDIMRRQLWEKEVYPKWWTYGSPDAMASIEACGSRELRDRAVRESRRYIMMPHPNKRGQHISISSKKLAPIVAKLVNSGIHEISYEGLLRVLGM